MKKFIALGMALAVLMLSFIPSVKATEPNFGVSVCDDLEPNTNTHD